MPRIVRHLSDNQVRKIKDAGRHCIGPGFYLRVSDQGTRYFEARVTDHLGKRRWVQIGNAETMPIAVARTQAANATDRVKDATEIARPFSVVAEAYITNAEPGWKGDAQAAQWRQQLADYAYPKIGNAPCDKIRASDVADILRPIWFKKQETSSRVRNRIEVVIRAEMARLNKIEWNPATVELMNVLLPKRKRERGHFQAPTLAELQTLYASLKDGAVTHRALKCLILSATRTTEVREAQWGEIDGDTWTIPAARMKAGKAHTVPLTAEMQRLLERYPTTRTGLVFPNQKGEAPSINAMRAILQRAKVGYTVHGIRSTFRSWAEEQGIREAVSELCLAHTPENKMVKTYQRSDLLKERREVMQTWEAVVGGNV